MCRLRAYLADMREHMPPSHRAFLQQLEAGPSVREAVQAMAGSALPSVGTGNTSSDSSSELTGTGNVSSSSNCSRLITCGKGSAGGLVEAYNEAVFELERFRAQHRGFANSYIAQWSKKEVGTGGSDFMPALSSYKEATAAHRLPAQGCPLHQ